MFKIKGLDRIALRTIQLDKMRFFYCDLLRFIAIYWDALSNERLSPN